MQDIVNNLPSAQIDWGKPVGDGRPLADGEVIARLQDIKKQIGGSYAIERAIEVLKWLSSVQPEQRWIPVAEKHPEENQICIVTDETKQNTYEYRFCKQTYDEEQGWTYLKHRIIAWMPLPEPYKGE